MAPLSNQLTFVVVVIFAGASVLRLVQDLVQVLTNPDPLEPAAGFGLLYDSNKGDVSTQYCGQEPVELLQALERQVPPPNPVVISLAYNVCIDRE